MQDVKRRFVAFVAMSAFAGLFGCATNETTVRIQASSAAVASTESVSVSVSTATVSVSQPTDQTPSPTAAVDILKDEKKPCGTVAADAPKFTEPEDRK